MIIALKGYIGSGKSTLGKILEKDYGFKVINADNIVQDLYDDINLQKEICEQFELEKFSKKELSKKVFKDEILLKKLETIMHPLLENEMNELIASYEKNIVLDCQVIDKLNIEYDYEILTVCPKEEIIKRVCMRDEKQEEEVINILKNQEKFIIQTRKIFPIHTTDSEDKIRCDLEKILKIFTNDKTNEYYEDEDDDDYDW